MTWQEKQEPDARCMRQKTTGQTRKTGKLFLEVGKEGRMTLQRGSSLKMGEGKQRGRLPVSALIGLKKEDAGAGNVGFAGGFRI